MLEVKHLTVRSKEGRPLVQDVSFTLTPGKPMGLTGARKGFLPESGENTAERCSALSHKVR